MKCAKRYFVSGAGTERTMEVRICLYYTPLKYRREIKRQKNPLLFLQLIRLNSLLVIIRIVHAHVIQKRAAAGNFSKQSATCGKVFLMFLKMLCEQSNLFG